MDILFSALVVVFGLIIGSFLNVVAYRGPQMWGLIDDERRVGDLISPGSYCPACQSPLKAMNLVPVLSFVFQGGKCARCAARIPVRYPLVELAGGASAFIAFMVFGPGVAAIAAATFLWFLIALSIIDFETGYLPDMLTIPLGVIGLACAAGGVFIPFTEAIIGAVTGFTVFWVIGAGFRKYRGIDGLGGGDAKLLAALGAWLGWKALAPIVLFGSVLALAGYFIARALGADMTKETELPFGPALAAAGAGVLIAFGAGFNL